MPSYLAVVGEAQNSAVEMPAPGLVRVVEDVGFTHLHLPQVGPDLAGLVDFFDREVGPRL